MRKEKWAVLLFSVVSVPERQLVIRRLLAYLIIASSAAAVHIHSTHVALLFFRD